MPILSALDALAVVGIEALVILFLIGALLAGQGTATQDRLDKVTSQATEISQLKSVISAYPTPTQSRCMPTPYFYSC